MLAQSTTMSVRQARAAPRAAGAIQIMPQPSAALSADIAATPESLSFDIVTTRARFDALEHEWNALFERAGRSIHVFQTFNWCWHWCNHFLPGGESRGRVRLSVLVARREGRLVMVWPLIRQRLAGLSVLSFLGAPVSQYGDVLVDDLPDMAMAMQQAWTHLLERTRPDAIHLRKVRADATIAPLIEARGAIAVERLEAPYLDLASAPDFAAYEQRFSSKARKNRRRLLRRFEERSPAVLAEYREGERAREIADLALILKRAWLKDKGLVSPALADPRTAAFFRDVADAGERPVGCNITSLQSRGEATALEIAFDCKGRRVVHVIVYALKYERLSPGQLLIEQSLKQAFNDRLACYDLMAPADAYKMEWADGTVAVVDWAYGASRVGDLYARHYLTHLQPRIKHTVRRVASMLRRRRRPLAPPPAEAAEPERE